MLTDAFTCTVVGTVRKLLTIILSIVLFGKAWSYMHVIGVSLAITGVMVTSFQKAHKKH